MSEVDLEGPSDEELFSEAVGGEATDSPVVDQQHEEQVETTTAEPEAKTEAEIAEEKAIEDESKATGIPGWRLREINEERKTAIAERDALRAEKAQWEARQPQQPAQKAEQPKAERPDPILDPEGYAKAIREEIRQEALTERREESLHRAREANPQEFDEAYAAATKAVDPALKARMQASRDPGKTLLEWHRENKVKAEVGNDPNAWLEKKLEERLSDPAFLAKAIERSKGIAQPATTGGRPKVDLPPSISNLSRSNTILKSAGGDELSDQELFDKLVG